MTKQTGYLILFAVAAWLVAIGYADYSKRKPWSTENGSVHLSDCPGAHETCLLQGRIRRGWNSKTYVLTTPEGVEHKFTWSDIHSMTQPAPGLNHSEQGTD